MPRHESARLKLSYGWLRGEDWWGDPVSGNFLKLDMLSHPYAISMTETTPPINGLTVGDTYIVGVGATMAWQGHENALAVYVGDTYDGGTTEWIFCTPTRGVRVRLANPASWVWFEGNAWIDESQDDITTPPPLGSRYDVSVSVGYEAEPEDVLLVFAVPEAMTLPDKAVGSTGRCMASPSSIHRLTLKRNGGEIGTIVFDPSSVRATNTVVGNKPFAAGDLLTVHMPTAPAPGFQNYSFTLRLLLQNNGG
jgi:hypothetical protein